MLKIASLPAGPLARPQWGTALDAEASTEGTDGVLFLLTAAGAFVIMVLAPASLFNLAHVR